MANRRFRVVALLATYNEERFVAGCVEHLIGQGVEVYLIDNGSTDGTITEASPYLGRGLIAIEPLARGREFSLTSILRRKEALAATIDADWFIHHDADEIRTAPRPEIPLRDALAEVDAAGYNAVNFLEFVFVPTAEAPDHDHRRFRETMRHYYLFLPRFPHRLNAWKRQPEPVELAWSAGHEVRFRGLVRYPTSFCMRHYMFLSADHARRKYGGRIRTAAEEERGWGGWRCAVAQAASAQGPRLPRQAELREYAGGESLDCSDTLTVHPWGEEWARRVRTAPGHE